MPTTDVVDQSGRALPGSRLDSIFRARSAQFPDRIAVSAPAGLVTYKQLDDRSEAVAADLADRGVGPGHFVGLCAERDLDLIIGMLGILKAGAAYVPLDPAYPDCRLAVLARDAAIKFIVTSKVVMPRARSLGECILVGDKTRSITSLKPRSDFANSDIAYVIYTSGSTGIPKGVPIEHKNVVRLLEETELWFGFKASDVWTMFHSICFDFSVWEIWGALAYGGKLVIVPQDVARSPADFIRLIAREQVTVLNQTPSAFRHFVEEDKVRDHSLISSLRYVILGGEALPLRWLRPWVERHGASSPVLINMYGITETTVHATYRKISCQDLTTHAVCPIGVPIPDLAIHLLDANLRAVPDGVPGEICVSGAGLARGYLNRPHDTESRFIFHLGLNKYIYRSGDLGAVTETGEYTYHGRMDDQLKVSGFRIEPGEIERLLESVPGIAGATVLARTYADGDARLVAYVQRDQTMNVSDDKLRESSIAMAAAQLPQHMRPSAYVLVETFPLTTNGKIDKQALLSLPSVSFEPGTKPRTSVVERVTSLWETVLETKSTGVDDDFFASGGTSLALLRLLATLSKEFGCALDGRAVVNGATIAVLSEAVSHGLLEGEPAE